MIEVFKEEMNKFLKENQEHTIKQVEVFISPLSPIYRSFSCSLDVLGYPVLGMVGELGFYGTKFHWLFLFVPLYLPSASWLSLESAGLVVPGSSRLLGLVVLCDSRTLGRQAKLWPWE